MGRALGQWGRESLGKEPCLKSFWTARLLNPASPSVAPAVKSLVASQGFWSPGPEKGFGGITRLQVALLRLCSDLLQ